MTWAAVSDYKKRFQEESESFKKWKKTGRTFVENGRTKQQMPHDWQFYEDFIENEKRLTIKRAVTFLDKPCLFIHGSEDPTVSINEAKNLKSWSMNPQLEIIKEANHVFGASHPWGKENLPKQLQKVVEITSTFLKN